MDLIDSWQRGQATLKLQEQSLQAPPQKQGAY